MSETPRSAARHRAVWRGGAWRRVFLQAGVDGNIIAARIHGSAILRKAQCNNFRNNHTAPRAAQRRAARRRAAPRGTVALCGAALFQTELTETYRCSKQPRKRALCSQKSEPQCNHFGNTRGAQQRRAAPWALRGAAQRRMALRGAVRRRAFSGGVDRNISFRQEATEARSMLSEIRAAVHIHRKSARKHVIYASSGCGCHC